MRLPAHSVGKRSLRPRTSDPGDRLQTQTPLSVCCEIIFLQDALGSSRDSPDGKRPGPGRITFTGPQPLAGDATFSFIDPIPPTGLRIPARDVSLYFLE
jgi:hypothetical protein